MRGTIFVLILVLWVSSCSTQEVTVTEKDVPEQVLTSFRAAFASAEIKEYCREKENGKVLYEISFIFEGAEYDVTYTPEGKTDAVEKTISIENLPESIVNGITKKFPQSRIYKAEEITKGDVIYYEVKVIDESEKKEKKYELKYSKDRQLVDEGEEDEEEN